MFTQPTHNTAALTTAVLLLVVCGLFASAGALLDKTALAQPLGHIRPNALVRTALQAKQHAAQNAARLHVHVKLQAATHAGYKAVQNHPRPLGDVVMIGDSMAWPIGLALNPLLEADGHAFRYLYLTNDALHFWESDRFSRLKDGLRRYDPGTVIIVMGTNDFLHPNVEELTDTITTIEEMVHPRPCYWVGPPKLWRADTGIVDLLVKTVKRCSFLNSKPLKIDRGRDGWHPSPTGAADWASMIHKHMKAHPFRWGDMQE